MATKTKKAPEPEPELEDLESDAEETEASEEEQIWGVRDLCALLKKKTGKDYTPREVRTLLRKMAREDKPRVNRVIEADNRSRYAWTGPDDPEVKRIMKAVTGGEIEANKTEALAKLKADKAAKQAAAGTKSTKSKTKATTKVVEPDEDDDDLDELDDDE